MRSFTGDEPFEPVVASVSAASMAGATGERHLRLWPKGGRLTPVGGRIVMGVSALGLILLAWQSFSGEGGFAALGIGTFALLWTAGVVLMEVRAWQDRKVAALMRERSTGTSLNEVRQAAAKVRDAARSAVPMRLDVYLQGELKELPGCYLTPVGTDIGGDARRSSMTAGATCGWVS